VIAVSGFPLVGHVLNGFEMGWRALGPTSNFGAPHPRGLCNGAMYANGPFDLTLSLLARYDV
jgi:hypothetical protein